ncbi:MAG: hypothetical protein VX438_14505 [Planctomycetota bacterium]|nr:hypothetical protein [Planctomycetota bacterium]
MNQRTVYLLAGAGLLGLLYLADLAYRVYVEEPTRKRQTQLSKLNKGIDEANDLIAQRTSVQTQLDAYEKMSLPLDTEVTRTKYQGWLLGLVKSLELSGTTIDASAPVPVTIKRQKPKRNQSQRKTVMYRYNYSLRFRGSLQQLVTFLYRFYRSGQLHKIRSLSLNPSGGGATIDANFSIEALALVRTERETELSGVFVNRLKNPDDRHYLAIARRNIFSRTGSNILNQVRITGITFGKSGKPQVWIKAFPNQASMVFHNDEKVTIESHQLEILDIQTSSVLLLVDGQPIQVKLGKAIMESKKPIESKNSNPKSAKNAPNGSTEEHGGQPPQETKKTEPATTSPK